MGVKFGREYEDIVTDLTAAIRQIDDCYEFIEMPAQDWRNLNDEEQTACLTTLADDIFYALGQSAQINVGQGKLTYHAGRHVISVAHGDSQVTIVSLI